MKTGGAGSKGISPVIAELLVVTLAVAIAIGVIGYVMGWFSWSTAKTEALYVYPDSKLVIDYGNNTVYAIIKVYSSYKPALTVEKIYIDANKVATGVEVLAVYQGGPVDIEGTTVVLPDGTKALLKVTFNVEPANVRPDVPGKKEVRIVTNEGFLIKAYLRMEYRG